MSLGTQTTTVPANGGRRSSDLSRPAHTRRERSWP
jgi:hypothetical protein